jgi:glucose/mannose-6-phosphate isomerase
VTAGGPSSEVAAPEERLDDVAGLEAQDPQAMLRAVASGAAQVREAATFSAEAGVAGLADDGRPRAVVVCGMGGSGIAGDVLAAVAGLRTPVPIVVHRGFGLPAWVGPVDLVIAVSSSGTTAETLSALEEAVRRGCRLLVVGAAGSPLDELGRRGRGVVVPVTQGRQPRASIWALSTPLVVAGDALGLLDAPASVVERAASLLEDLATRCRVDADHLVNPAKRLALELSGQLPVLWGSSPLAGVAAYRFACQLNENAHTPAPWGVLPEAGHNQIVGLDGTWAGVAPAAAADAAQDDFFRDRGDDEDDLRAVRLHLVLLRDSEEHEDVALRADVAQALAQERGVGVSALRAEGASSFERFVSLVGLTDYASVYLALLEGTDPTPIEAITALKQRTTR